MREIKSPLFFVENTKCYIIIKYKFVINKAIKGSKDHIAATNHLCFLSHITELT